MADRILVLDDDPTGTQSATGVPVLLAPDENELEQLLVSHPSVYALTNSRALPVEQAVALLTDLRDWARAAAEKHGWQLSYVLRGDSTLRGHVFPEIEVFESDSSVVVFVPAFPAGGRRTRGGVHYVRVGEKDINAADSEFARDPVFGYTARSMRDYVAEFSPGRGFASVPPGGVGAALISAAAHEVVVPDVEDDGDIAVIAAGVREAQAAGREVVVRCGAPLAAALAGATSVAFLDQPIARPSGPVLVVCGSHTESATAQLARLAEAYGDPVVVSTDRALTDPAAAGAEAAATVDALLDERDVVLLSSERTRRAEHNRLDHGERVMTALTSAVAAVAGRVSAVIAKGGITSAEVARQGLGGSAAVVRGQVMAGVSVWDVTDRTGREVPYAVVPGNVGGPDTLMRVADAFGLTAGRAKLPE